MHETDLNPTLPSSEPAEGLEASALRAHAWYGEPFLHAGEDPAAALAPGTAGRGVGPRPPPPCRPRRCDRGDGRGPEDPVEPLARPLRADARAGARARGA